MNDFITFLGVGEGIGKRMFKVKVNILKGSNTLIYRQQTHEFTKVNL